MKDFIENMEDAAQRRYDDVSRPNGQMKCECGKLFNEDDGDSLGESPYAPLVCPDCLEEFFDEHEEAIK